MEESSNKFSFKLFHCLDPRRIQEYSWLSVLRLIAFFLDDNEAMLPASFSPNVNVDFHNSLWCQLYLSFHFSTYPSEREKKSKAMELLEYFYRVLQFIAYNSQIREMCA